MIKSFRHNGLKLLYEKDNPRRVPSDMASRLRRILAILDTAKHIDELSQYPGWRLHRLKCDLKDNWSISISGNWRIIFRFNNNDVFDIDLIDYH